jgi:hypothetical protein
MPFYYIVYFLRRILRAPLGSKGLTEWKFRVLLLVASVRLAYALVELAFQTLLEKRLEFGRTVLLGLLVAVALYFLLENSATQQRHFRRFESWPKAMRGLTDGGAAALVVFALFSPLIVRTLVTDIPWWK